MKKTDPISELKEFLDRNALSVIILLSIVFIIYTGFFGILDHLGLRTNLDDLGHHTQALWQLTQFNLKMPITVFWGTIPSFAVHINVIFYLLGPIFALFPSPITLICISHISAGLAGILIFLLAREVLKNNLLALMFGFLFLINPFIQETALFDFRPIVLALPLALGVFLSLEKRKWKYYWLCVALLLTVKEDMPVVLMALSPFIFFYRSKKHGVLTFVISLTYLATVMYLVEHFLGASTGDIALKFNRFAYLGESTPEIAKNLILNPEKTFFLFKNVNKIDYLLQIFFNGSYLGILSPLTFLVVLPEVALNFLDQTGFQTKIGGVYYTGIVITLLYVSVIYGCKRILNKPVLLGILLFLFGSYTFFFTAIYSPLPYSIAASWEDYKLVHDREAFERISKLIPLDASLAIQNNLGSHFAKREFIGRIVPELETEYVLIHTQAPFARENNNFLRNNSIMMISSMEDYKETVLNIFKNPEYGILDFESGFFLFKRGHSRNLNGEALEEAEGYLTAS